MFASTSDVSTRLGRTLADGAETAQVQAWIDDVETRITERIPTIVAMVSAGSPSVATAMSVVCDVVIRKINNPTGKLQERVDDYSYGLTADSARSDLSLTTEEWARLTPASSAGAFSIRPGYDSGSTEWAW